MELKEAISKLVGLTETEKQYWNERCDELNKEGLSKDEVADRVIAEMKEDADKDLAQLKSGLGKK
jgi:uncharacterized protein YoaH (UPF0181 family)